MATKIQMQIELEDKRRLRDNTFTKINNYRKKGKDVTALQAELKSYQDRVAWLVDAIKNYDTRPVPKKEPVKKVVKKKEEVPAKKWKKSELEACHSTLDKYLEDNDWCAGYQFRSSDWMFIKSLETKVVDNGVALVFVIQYKTPNHRVERVVSKIYNPTTVSKVDDFINALETWVMLNSGDKDDNNIVFGDRFNKVQFEKQEFARKGWVIYK